jgi:hypothetical protein
MQDVAQYQKTGTRERILLVAGLVEVNEGALSLSQRTVAFFGGSIAPGEVEKVAPHLLQLVDAEIADRSGVASGSDTRLEALKHLLQAGLREQSKFLLVNTVVRGAEAAQAELSETKQASL